jgi:hypothetical protein
LEEGRLLRQFENANDAKEKEIKAANQDIRKLNGQIWEAEDECERY